MTPFLYRLAWALTRRRSTAWLVVWAWRLRVRRNRRREAARIATHGICLVRVIGPTPTPIVYVAGPTGITPVITADGDELLLFYIKPPKAGDQ